MTVPFSSFEIVAARPSESSASTASAGGCFLEDFLRNGFSGGPKPWRTHSHARLRRSNFRSSFITVCLSRLPLFRPGVRCVQLRLPALPPLPLLLPLHCKPRVGKRRDFFSPQPRFSKPIQDSSIYSPR